MKIYTQVVSDMTPGELEHARQEWRTNPETFADKVKLSPEDAAVVAAAFKAEDAARGE